MFSLVLHGKIPITEDVLTAAFFDALADEQDVALLTAIIREAHGHQFVVPEHFAFTVELWPRISTGEPDARIRFKVDDTTFATLLVEAKLWAPKSGSGELGEDKCSGDQLARYLVAESECAKNVFLLYLTHHGVSPDADLAESREHLRRAGRGELSERFLWMSWRTIERKLASSELRSYHRVRDLLRRVSMYWFEGIQLIRAPTFSSAPSFYRPEPITYPWQTVPDCARRKWWYGDTNNVNYLWQHRENAVPTRHSYRRRDR